MAVLVGKSDRHAVNVGVYYALSRMLSVHCRSCDDYKVAIISYIQGDIIWSLTECIGLCSHAGFSFNIDEERPLLELCKTLSAFFDQIEGETLARSRAKEVVLAVMSMLLAVDIDNPVEAQKAAFRSGIELGKARTYLKEIMSGNWNYLRKTKKSRSVGGDITSGANQIEAAHWHEEARAIVVSLQGEYKNAAKVVEAIVANSDPKSALRKKGYKSIWNWVVEVAAPEGLVKIANRKDAAKRIPTKARKRKPAA